MTTQGLEDLFNLIGGQSGTSLNDKQRASFRLLLTDQQDAHVLKMAAMFYRSPEAGMRKAKVPVAGDLIEQPQARADAAALAWATVRRAIGEVGSYRSVEFEDGAITASVKALGGWVELCNKSPKDLDILAYQFKTLYQGFMGKCEPETLAGRHELQNGANRQLKELEPARTIPTLGSSPSLPQLTEGEA